MMHPIVHHGAALAAVLGLAGLGGCDVEAVEPDAVEADADAVEADAADIDAPGDIRVGHAPAYTYNGWTPYTSDEFPPIGCDPGSMVNGARCTHNYCDNISLLCEPTGAAAGNSYWTPYFSEEGAGNQVCADRHWLSGLACKGSYCDNIALLCTYYPDVEPKHCYWTGWMSEEGGGALNFGPGYYARGAQCEHSYCDNKRYYVCQR